MLRIPIIIAAYNRPNALCRILASLRKANYPQEVKLIISIDGEGSQDVIDMANDFLWEFGEKEIVIHEYNLGLRQHILSCGDLSLNYDGIILLEDDLYVSPVFYHYTIQAFKFYQQDTNVAGISLYAHDFNETALFPFRPMLDGSDVFFLQLASSWGQCWSAKQWLLFKEWYEKEASQEILSETFLPSDVLLWPETSWKKYFIKYLIEQDKYFVYPRYSLTTNFGDKGAHHNENKWFQVPLQYEHRQFILKEFAKSNAVYDSFCEILPLRLNRLQPELSRFDYSVDLYGMKPLSFVKSDLILTTKKAVNTLLEYGRELIPLESNVYEAIKGGTIVLAAKKDCEDVGPFTEYVCTVCSDTDNIFYHHKIGEIHFYRKNMLIKERNHRLKEKQQRIDEKQQRIDEKQQEIQEKCQLLQQKNDEISKLTQERNEFNYVSDWRLKEIARVREVAGKRITGMQSTLSWKITRPLRYVGKVIGRLMAK